jgi:hypothetical protein
MSSSPIAGPAPAAAPPAFTPPPLAVIITTHTTRHLRRTLIGSARQSRAPDRLAVSCDNDDPEIRALVEEAAGFLGRPILLVSRPFTGQSRSAQVRNNAVRAAAADLPAEARLVFLDGDCVPAPDALAAHERLGGSPRPGRPGNLVIGFRIDLSSEQTAAFSDEALRNGLPPVEPTAAQRLALARRARRYRRQARLRRIGLAKAHKPKLLSANFSVLLRDFAAVNGFDESYEGYGQEDDDFGRRLYRAGCRPVIAIEAAIAYHLYHDTRAPGRWHRSPNAARFRRAGPIHCERGLDNPLPQPPVCTVECRPTAATVAAIA